MTRSRFRNTTVVSTSMMRRNWTGYTWRQGHCFIFRENMKSEAGQVQIEVEMLNIRYALKDLIWEEKRKGSDWRGDGQKDTG